MTAQSILNNILFLLLPTLIAGIYFPMQLVRLGQNKPRNSKAILFWGLVVLFLMFYPIVGFFITFEPIQLLTKQILLIGTAFCGHTIIRQIIYRHRLQQEKVLWNLGRANQLNSIFVLGIIVINSLSLFNRYLDGGEPLLNQVLAVLFMLSFAGFWATFAFSPILVLEKGIATIIGIQEWDNIQQYEWGTPHNEKVILTIGGMTVKVPVSQQAQIDAYFQAHHVARAPKNPYPKPEWLKDASPEWVEYQEKKQAILDKRPKKPLAPIIHRAVALVIDVMVIFGPIYVLSQIIFYMVVYQLGPYTRLLSFAILIAYLTIFNSSLGKGQTLGQRMTQLAVVDRNYQLLSPGRAFIRSTILALIVMLIAWDLPIFEDSALGTIALAIAIGGIFALLYGWFTNGVTQQGIHELLTGSYVVKWPPVTPDPLPRTPKKHWIATIALFVFGVLLTTGLASLFSRPEWQLDTTYGRNFDALEATLTDHDAIISAKITESRTAANIEQSPRGNLIVDLWVGQDCSYRSDSYGCEDLMDEIAIIVLEQYGFQGEYGKLTISMENKYDIGLPIGGNKFSRTHPVSQWLRDLGIIGV